MKSKLNNSLSWKALLYILLFSSFVVLLAGAAIVYREYRMDLRLIDEKLETIRTSYLDSLAAGLWDVNSEFITAQLDGILTLRDIERVQLIDSTKAVSIVKGSDMARNLVSREFPLHYAADDGSQVAIGTLTVFADRRHARVRAVKRAVFFVIIEAINVLFVSIFILLLIYRLITRHLIGIADYSSSLSLEHLDHDLVLSRAHNPDRHDELDRVVQALNEMRLRLGQEIASRERAEAETARSRHMFKAIFEQAAVGMAQVSSTGHCIMANARFCQIVGVPQERVVHAPITALLQLEDGANGEQGPGQLLAERFSEERPLLCQDGSSAWVAMTVFPLTLPSDRTRSHIIIIEDVSERKQIQERLQHTQKMESIGVLAGGIAHDFNNLLAAILGFTEMSKLRVKPGSEIAEDLDHIEDTVCCARELVQRILQVSRKTETNMVPRQLSDLIKDVLTIVRASVSPRIQVKAEFQPNLPDVFTDESRMYQMVLNLCNNAAQSMPDGGCITVKLERATPAAQTDGVPAASDFVLLTVQDTGCGIKQELLEHVFDPFFTTKDRGTVKGTGLGLSIVASIVKQHRGYIKIDSQPGKGSRVKVYLPVYVQQSVPEDAAAAPAPHSTDKQERVLLVDDEMFVIETTKRMLSRLGYVVTAFTDARRALKAFTATPDAFDLVVTDYAMPGCSGAELIAEIRKLRQGQPVLLISGFSNLKAPESMHALGCDGMLAKPFTYRELQDAVRKYVH